MTEATSILTGLAQIFGTVPIAHGPVLQVRPEGNGVAPVADSAPAVREEADRAEISSEARRAENQQGSQQTDQTGEVADLQRRDQEVRAHEQAHKAAGGQYAGAITYSLQTGPDGRRYAVGGSVSIDHSPVEGDPRATIQKMEQVRRAATAPANPSPADLQVAAAASQKLLQALQELAAEVHGERKKPGQTIDITA